jgi:hypothetical protein
VQSRVERRPGARSRCRPRAILAGWWRSR